MIKIILITLSVIGLLTIGAFIGVMFMCMLIVGKEADERNGRIE